MGKVPEVLREIQVFLVAQVVLASLDQMEDLVPLDLTVAMASQDQGDLLEHQVDYYFIVHVSLSLFHRGKYCSKVTHCTDLLHYCTGGSGNRSINLLV